MVAVQSNNFDMVRLLVANKADIDRHNSSGASALSIAVTMNNMLMIDTLVKYGADIKILYKDSMNISMNKYKINNKEISKYVRKQGVKTLDINWDLSLASISTNSTDFEYGCELQMNK